MVIILKKGMKQQTLKKKEYSLLVTKSIRVADENLKHTTKEGVCKGNGGQLLIAASCNVQMGPLKTYLTPERKMGAIIVIL